MEHPARVLLVRHGQTDANADRRFCGRWDLPLNAAGIAEIGALAAWSGAVTAVYSSPLLRARQTARLIGPPTLIPALAELDQGSVEGLTGAEAEAAHPGLLEAWWQRPGGLRFPGGESMADVQARVVPAVREIVRAAPPGLVAIVGHQAAHAALLCALSDTPLDDWRRFALPNGGVRVLRAAPGTDALALDPDPHPLPPPTAAPAHPCLRCGACCAAYRVGFYWAEADDGAGPVPAALTEPVGPLRRAMAGTARGATPRCIALAGHLGARVACTIHPERPSPCREFAASHAHGQAEPRCDDARARHGLPPLTAADWDGIPAAAR